MKQLLEPNAAILIIYILTFYTFCNNKDHLLQKIFLNLRKELKCEFSLVSEYFYLIIFSINMINILYQPPYGINENTATYLLNLKDHKNNEKSILVVTLDLGGILLNIILHWIHDIILSIISVSLVAHNNCRWCRTMINKLISVDNFLKVVRQIFFNCQKNMALYHIISY